MGSGQIYEGAFQLSKLMTVSRELAEFPFSFQVMPQNFEVSIDNMTPSQYDRYKQSTRSRASRRNCT